MWRNHTVHHYFAFGSNMLRARLEARVGPVRDLGRAALADHRHRFNKRGADGTAKGNIVAAPGHQVHGVLYQLSAEQLETLSGFEGGYRRVELGVEHPELGTVTAVSFTAVAPMEGLRPTAEYLEHYEGGMLEHDLPAEYRRQILGDGSAANRD